MSYVQNKRSENKTMIKVNDCLLTPTTYTTHSHFTIPTYYSDNLVLSTYTLHRQKL